MRNKLLLCLMALGITTSIWAVVSMQSMDKHRILQLYRHHVVKLEELDGKGGGTGFIVNTPSGHTVTVTNHHICRERFALKLSSPMLRRSTVAHVLETDPEHDLCVLSAPAALPGADISNTDLNTDGEFIAVVGHPRLEGLTAVDGHIRGRDVHQIMSGDEKCTYPWQQKVMSFYGDLCISLHDSLEISADIQPGNSGSPLVNLEGEVIGVVFAGGQNGGLAIPLQYLRELVAVY